MTFEKWYEVEGSVMVEHGCSPKIVAAAAWTVSLQHTSQPILYQYPPTRFIQNTLWRQWWHLFSEVIELGRAIIAAHFAGNWQHAARESEDVGQSNETMKRILAERGADIALARVEVISGCLERGYYDAN